MARVKLSPLITSISGSVGGVTFQRNRYGMTARQKPLPPNVGSEAQNNVRTHMITIQKAWQALSDDDRLQWDRFTDFSNQTTLHDHNVKLSGHALYLKYQLFRLLCGLSLLTTIAYLPMPAYPEIDRIYRHHDEYVLQFVSNINSDSYFFIFSITTPRKLNQAFSKRGLRYMYITPATTGQFDIAVPYIAAFGILPPTAPLVHITMQWFSVIAPVVSAMKTAAWQITYI